jgi:hypothetical protein
MYWLITVDGGVEPDLIGPYKTQQTRSVQAKRIHRNQTDEDSLFKLNIYNGRPHIESYCAMEFE